MLPFDQNYLIKGATIILCKLFASCFLLSLSALLVAGEQGEVLLDQRSRAEADSQRAEKTVQEKALGLIDNVHASLSGRLIATSNYIDNFFVNARMDEEGSKSKVLFSYVAGYDVFRGGSSTYSLRAQLHLPKTQRRLRFIIDGDEARNDAENNIEQAGNISRIEELKAALQYIFLNSKVWRVSANTGVRFEIPLDPFAKLRIRRLFFVGGLTFRLTQSVFYFKSDGWGGTGILDIEKPLSDIYFFRSSSRITAMRDSGERAFSQSWSVFQDMGNKKLMAYTLGMNADLTSPAVTTLYFMKMRYRYNFYKKWAFYEIAPALSFDRDNDFSPSPGVIVKLDIVFGGQEAKAQ